jgi:hypothetical protein
VSGGGASGVWVNSINDNNNQLTSSSVLDSMEGSNKEIKREIKRERERERNGCLVDQAKQLPVGKQDADGKKERVARL